MFPPGPQRSQRREFWEDLEYSMAAADEPLFEAIYRKAFPDFAKAVLNRDNLEAQRAGVDRWVHLNGGKILGIDEKKREKSWPDIAIEFCHITGSREKKPGWIKNACGHLDYINYFFVEERAAFLLPWQPTRRVWEDIGEGLVARARKTVTDGLISGRLQPDWRRVAIAGLRGYSVIRSKNHPRRGQPYDTYSIGIPRRDLLDLVRDALEVRLA